MTLTVGSLFSGIGGLELGLERAGMRVAWQVESDAYALKVLTKHWPEVPKYEDVRTVTGKQLERVDVLCGGVPCQDISNAGTRVGIDGKRSGLWAEFHRLICELRPRYVVVENVAALLVRGMGRVLGDLAASGYDAEWDCIPAAAVGAPHRRDRLFVVAYSPRERRREGQSKPDTGRQAVVGGACGEAAAVANTDGERELQSQGPLAHVRGRTRDGGAKVADATRSRLAVFQGREAWSQLTGWRATPDSGWWNAEPDVGRVANGVPARVDRLRCLGNAVVPQVAEFIGRRIVALEAA